MFDLTTKKDLIQRLQKDPKKYWEVSIFKEKGFVRKQCLSCGKFFWTLNPETKLCGDSPCVSYSFISNSPCKKKMDYIQTWKAIEKFFVKNGHESIASYPSVCRWFPGLYFTIASIVSFQRKIGNETVFEFPANPLIIPQSCMRFNDIPNVGRTGKHYTNFVMIGQHSLYDGKKGYWKDRCTELDYELLTKVFNINPEEITWIEDVWLGPAAFGYSLEYFSRGLELGNAVFTEFIGTLDNYRVMDKKVIDMGAGLERFAWITQGTPTSYDATFGPVADRLKKIIDYDKKLFLKYSEIAGGLNIDEVRNIEDAKKKISKELGVTFEELQKHIEPVEAVYAITDHTKTLLFAVSDGALPSNVGGGYNLRVILRRALEFIRDLNLDIDLVKLATEHAKYLKPIFPNLKNGLERFPEIIDVEKKRFKETRGRGIRIVEKFLERGERLDENKLIQLYESNGITPELVEKIAADKKIRLDIPDDFYKKLSERHMTEKEEEKEAVDVSGLPPTKPLFYKNQKAREFYARVLKITDGKVVLDKTAFYPESGGQEADHGLLNKCRVYDVKKFGDVIVHYVEKPSLKKGQKVRGVIDSERREQLTRHHTAIHVINLAARKVLGRHIFQAGSHKSVDKAHLDVTHYKGISDKEIEEIERVANGTVKKGLRVKIEWLPRNIAEKRYGMQIYQGGAVPGKELRILSVGNLDHEACGGTHVENTREIETIVILDSERIQDGINRITIKAGKTAKEFLDKNINKIIDLIHLVKKDLHFVETHKDFLKIKPVEALRQLQECAKIFSVPIGQVEGTIKKFCRDIIKNCEELDDLRKKLGLPEKKLHEYLKSKTMKRLPEVCEYIFNVWKIQKKEIEKIGKEFAENEAKKLVKKIKEDQLFEVIGAGRRRLIEIANNLITKKPKLTVILSNQAGDLIVMSKTKDASKIIKDIASKAKGSGGGTKELAQGKVELSRLIMVMRNR